MKYSLILVALLSGAAFSATVQTAQMPPQASTINVVCPTGTCVTPPAAQKVQVINPVYTQKPKQDVLTIDSSLRIDVIGQGVAPMNTASPAQAYALAKRAATADAYRLIAEKVKGVRIEGDDLIKNMMVQRSTVRTSVRAMVRNANVVETTFKDGLCEVEMEIVLSHASFAH